MLTQVEVVRGVVPLAPDYVELRWLGELPPSLLEMGPVTEGQKLNESRADTKCVTTKGTTLYG